MAKELQSLIVQLEARDEKFAAVLTSVETRLGSFERTVKTSSSKIEAGFAGITGAIGKMSQAFGLLAGAAALGGLTKLASSALDAASDIVDFADRVGIGTEQLQALQFAASQAGLKTEEFNAGMLKFSRTLAAANSGVKAAADLFKGLGVSAAELGKDPAKAIEIVADRLAKVENQAQRVQIALALFGKGGAGFVNFLQQGSGEIERMTERARSLGIVIEDGLLRQSEALGDELEVVSKILSVNFQQALLSIAPLLVSAATAAANFARGIASVAQAVGLLNVPLREQITDTSKRVFDLQQHLQALQEQKTSGVGNVLPQFLDTAIEKTTSDIGKLTLQLQGLQGEFGKSQPQIKAVAGEWLQLGGNVEKTTKAKEKAVKVTRDINEGLREELEVLKKQSVILDAVLDGTIDWEKAQIKLAVAQKAGKGQDDQLAEAVVGLAAANKKKTESIEEAASATKKLAEEEAKSLQQQEDITREVGQSIIAQDKLTAIIKDGLANGRALADIEHDLAVAREKTQLVTKGYIGDQQNLAEAVITSAEAFKTGQDALDSYRQSLDSGIDFSGIFRDGLRGLAQGTLDVKNFMKQQGQALAVQFGEAFLFGKQGTLDKGFKLNINELVGGSKGGIIGELFGQGGQTSGQNFGGGLLQSLGTLFGGSGSTAGGAGTAGSFFGAGLAGLTSSSTGSSGGISGLSSLLGGLFGGGGSGGSGGGLGGLFGGSGASGASSSGLGGALGIAGIGVLIAGAVKDFKKGKYGSGGGAVVGGGIAGYFSGGNPQAIAAGAALGKLLGSLLDPLFKHVPTSGTTVRKSVIKFLDEIEVSFADELKSKKYFFEETKDLAKRVFGGDFLVASKQILNEKAGPELAKELSALGAFLTGDQAAKLGKSVEQTGTTFGNLLIANLGLDPEELQGAVDEIADKAGISFESLVKKLNSLFTSKEIGVDFFKDAISGAITLFHSDLPAAIDVAKLAAKAFTAEGILDLKTFEKELAKASGQYDLIAEAAGQTIQKRIAENLSGSDTKAAFLALVKDGLRNAAITAFLDEEIPKLFEGIDLTEPLELGSEAMATLAARAGVAADALFEMLRAAGLLPDALQAAVDPLALATARAQELVGYIEQLDTEISQLALKRVEIRIDLVERLTQIGSLTTLQAIDIRAKALLVQAAALTSVSATIIKNGAVQATPIADFFSEVVPPAPGLALEQIEEMLKIQEELAGLTVERYNAEAQALQESLQATIAGIQAETVARQAGIASMIQGLTDSKTLVQEYFAEQKQGLQESLQAAQAFLQVSAQLKQSITQLVTGPQSALSKPEQAAFIQRQLAQLKSQPFSAESAGQIGEALQQVLSTSIFAGGSVAFFEQFEGIVRELESLQSTTEAQGATAVSIQEQIRNIDDQSRITLASIDTQIAQQQQLLADLSIQEQRAIADANQGMTQRLDALRAQAEITLRDNAQQQERLAAEAQAKREALRQVAFGQLVTLVGTEQATRLLADQNFAMLYTLVQIRDVLANLDTTLGRIIPAANGFSGLVSQPRLFLAGERGPEYVSVTPNGRGTGGQTMQVSINAPLTVNLAGGATEADGERLGRGYIEALKWQVRHGDLGVTIAQRVR